MRKTQNTARCSNHLVKLYLTCRTSIIMRNGKVRRTTKKLGTCEASWFD